MKKKKAEERNSVKSGILKRVFREEFFVEGKERGSHEKYGRKYSRISKFKDLEARRFPH